MTHGTIIPYTLWCDGTRRHRFYCEYTSAGEEGVSVNSHWNSLMHNKNAKWLLGFAFRAALLKSKDFVILDVTLKSSSERSCLLFWLFFFFNPLAKAVTYQMFLGGDDSGRPHENCCHHAGFWSIITDSFAQNDFNFTVGYSYKTWATKRQ